MLALAALGLAPMLALARWRNRRRGTRLAAALQRDGFSVSTRLTDEERRAIHGRYTTLAGLGHEPAHTSWIAHKPTGGREVTALRHSHLAVRGTYWYEDTKLVVAFKTDDSRPGVRLSRTSPETVHGDEDVGPSPGLQFGDAWFDRNFRIESADPDSLTRILTPAVRGFIASGPSQESWAIGDGYVLCVFGADTSAEGISVMIERTRQLIDLLGMNVR